MKYMRDVIIYYVAHLYNENNLHNALLVVQVTSERHFCYNSVL